MAGSVATRALALVLAAVGSVVLARAALADARQGGAGDGSSRPGGDGRGERPAPPDPPDQPGAGDEPAGIWDVYGASMRQGSDLSAPWRRPTPWDATFAAVEARWGMPPGLLKRVAWQESRFRDDIVSGRTVSAAGAVGLMQIVPRWHPDVDPRDPVASIIYAGKYLARLKAKFGTWDLALAAYNWGPGNLARHGLGAAPPETVAYVTEIGADVGVV